MKIHKILISAFLATMLLGFTRAYAFSISDGINALKEIGNKTKNEDVINAATQASSVEKKYEEAKSIEKQIESAKTVDEIFSLLTQNSETLGISSADLAKLKTAYTNGKQAWDTNSRLTKTVKQIINDPKTTINQNTASQIKTDIESLLTFIEALRTAAEGVETNSSGDTGKNIGNGLTQTADDAEDAAQKAMEAINSGDQTTIQQAMTNLNTALNNLANINSNISNMIQTGAAGNTSSEYAMGIKNWEGQLGAFTTFANVQTDVCDRLFENDQQNLFKDVTCSLIKVVAASTAQLSTQMTCTIQESPSNSNYLDGASFTSTNGICEATNNDINPLNPSYIYGRTGTTSSVATGIYSGEISALTTSLASSTSGASQTYNVIKWILSIIAIVALLIFAFANILNIDVNTYAIKKAIPKVAVALVGGWLSLTIVVLLSRTVDVAYRLNIFSPYQSLHPMTNIFLGNFNLSSSTATSDLERGISVIFDIGSKFLNGGVASSPSFAGMLVGSFFLTIPALVVIIFEYVLAIRPFAVQFLAAAGPLAFACLILPQTQNLFKKWSTYLLIAISYPLVVNFAFFFLNKISGDYTFGSPAFIALWAFKIFVIIVLIRMPFAIESDVRKISHKLAVSDIGASLGLNKMFKTGIQPNATKSPASSQTDSNLSTDKARDLVVPISRKFFRTNIKPRGNATSNDDILNSGQLQSNSVMPTTLASLISNADRVNSSRTSTILKNSIQDIPAAALKAVVERDDLQLWRDTRLIEQLKNKDGQILDEQGAAIRADSIRKAIRLAQVADDGKLVNGDLIKLFASKGMLSSLPAGIVKEALRENILNNEDLITSYGSNYQRVLNSAVEARISDDQAKRLMAQDQRDHFTGYNRISSEITSAMTAGEIASQTTNAISNKMLQNGSGNLLKNSDYYMQRLSSDNSQAISSIGQALTKAGVDNKTAASLAQNTSLGLDQVSQYIPKQQQNTESLQQIKEGLFNRDVTGGLISEIGGIVIQEKTSSSRAITKRVADVFKNDENANIAGVQTDIKSMIEKLEGPTSPDEIEEIANKIGKYHPGAKIKTNQKYDQNEIDQIKQRAEEVLQTTEKIQGAGFDEKKVVEDPMGVSKTVETEIARDVQNKARGTVAKSNKFDQNLNVISKAIEKNDGRQ